MIEFIKNMTVNNSGLWFHMLVAIVYSFGMKLAGVNPMVTISIVASVAIGYEAMQAIEMFYNWKGWSWTVYRTRIRWIADSSGDIIFAVACSAMVVIDKLY